MEPYVLNLSWDLLFQLGPVAIIDLAQSNKKFYNQVQSEDGIKKLKDQYKWPIRTFSDFIDITYTTHLTLKADDYFDLEYCLLWAIREGNEELADYWFEKIRFTQSEIVTMGLLNRMLGSAARHFQFDMLKWCEKKIEPYRSKVAHLFVLKQATKSGDIKMLDILLRYPVNLEGTRHNRFTAWQNLFAAALESGNMTMIDKIRNLPLMRLQNENILPNIPQVWEYYLRSAIKSGKKEIVEYVKNLAVSNKVDWKEDKHQYFIVATSDLSLIEDHFKELIRRLMTIPNKETLDETHYEFIYKLFQGISKMPNDIELASQIIDWIPNELLKEFIVYVRCILNPIANSGNVKLLHYCIQRLNLSPQSIDRIYQIQYKISFDDYGYELLTMDQRELDDVIKESFEDLKTASPHIYGESKALAFVSERREEEIFSGNHVYTEGIPSYPGIWKTFRKYGENTRIYKLDFINACVMNDLKLVDRLILVYKIDSGRRKNEALIQAAEVSAFDIIERLLKDYRVDPSARDNYLFETVISNFQALPSEFWEDENVLVELEPDFIENEGNVKMLKLLLADPRVDISYNDYVIFDIFKNNIESIEIADIDLFFDWRINLELLKARRGPVPLLDSLLIFHTMKNLSYQDRFQLMKDHLSDLGIFENPKFERYYLMSDKQLAEQLNYFKVPWIPHLNHLAACIFLANPNEDFENIVPAVTMDWIQAAISYMKEKFTYGVMIDSLF